MGEVGFEPTCLSAYGPKPYVSIQLHHSPNINLPIPRPTETVVRAGATEAMQKPNFIIRGARANYPDEKASIYPSTLLGARLDGYSPSLTNSTTFLKTAGSCSARSARIFLSSRTLFFLRAEINLL